MKRIPIVKGYLITGILFFIFSCNEPVRKEASSVNPEDCEWYVVPESPLNGGTKNRLDVYVLRLYPNKSYVLAADLIFETGTWSFDEEKQLMVLRSKTSDGSEQLRYVLDEKLKDGKTLFTFYNQYPFTDDDKDEVVEVRALPNQSSTNPYDLSMHTWRNKPAQAETPAQIKERTLNYLRFLEAMYTHALDNNLENPGGRWYPKPLKFFSNKVSMAYADELTDWYGCFYNEAQGIEAYKLLSGALMKVKITGDDYVSRNLNCVKQLISNL